LGSGFDVNLTINNTDLRARKMQGKQYRLGDQIITGYAAAGPFFQ
jgi:hypothetical protein